MSRIVSNKIVSVAEHCLKLKNIYVLEVKMDFFAELTSCSPV